MKNNFREKLNEVAQDLISQNAKKMIRTKNLASSLPVSNRIQSDFANTGTVTPMTETDWNKGLQSSIPASKLNYLFSLFSECLLEVQQQGLLAYSPNTTYQPNGASWVSYSGQLYHTIGSSPIPIGTEPTNTTYWDLFKAGGATQVNKVLGNSEIIANPTTGDVNLTIGSTIARLNQVTKTQVGLSNVPNLDCSDADNIKSGKTNIILTETEYNDLAKESEISALTANKVNSPATTTENYVPTWQTTEATGSQKTLENGLPVGVSGSASLVLTNSATNKLSSSVIPHIPISETRTFMFDLGTTDTAIWSYIVAHWTDEDNDPPALGATVFVMMSTTKGGSKYTLYEIWSFVQHSTPETATDWQIKTNWVERVLSNEVISVNGATGAVTLNTDDIPAGGANLYFSQTLVSANATVKANSALGASNLASINELKPQINTLNSYFHILNS